MSEKCTLGKAQRLWGYNALEDLFTQAHLTAVSYPLKAVYRITGEPRVRAMFVVGKRFHKRAVKRNRLKRLMREAYRLHQHWLKISDSRGADIAFLWNSTALMDYQTTERHMLTLLSRINETLQAASTKGATATEPHPDPAH